MIHVFGVWDLDPERPALVNKLTGEAVVICDRDLIDQPAPIAGWTRFEYEHADLRYPILVECAGTRIGDRTLPAWRVDHDRSAVEWLSETGLPEKPAYGTWRRVDDCITDALACWPDVRAGDDKDRGRLSVTGGWLNGEWRADFRRDCWWLSQYDKRRYDRPIDPNVGSWIMPLDAPPPMPFAFNKFVLEKDAPVGQKAEPIGVDNEIPLQGLTIREGNRKYGEHECHVRELDLPAGLPLSESVRKV
jgi:hypothetical protein